MDTAAALPLFVGPTPGPPGPTMPSSTLTESLLMRLHASTSEGAPVQRSQQLASAAAAAAAAINEGPVFSGTPVALPPLSVESLLGIGGAPAMFSPANTAAGLTPLSEPAALGMTFLPGSMPAAGWFTPPAAPQGLRLPPSALGSHPDPSAETSHHSIATEQLERGGSVPNLRGLPLGQHHDARAVLVDEVSTAHGHGSNDRLTSLVPGADDGLDLEELFRHFGGNTPRAGTVPRSAAAAAAAFADATSPRGRPGSPDLKQMYETFVTDIEGGMPPDLAARLVPQAAAAPLAGALAAAATTKASRSSTPQVPRPQGLRALPPKKRSYSELESGPSTPEKLAFPGPMVKRRAVAPPTSPATRNQALVPQSDITALLPGVADGVLHPQGCRHLFGKIVTRSDVSKLGRIVLPRAGVEACFPPCHDRNGVPLVIYDTRGRHFDVVLKFWMNGRPVAKRMWLLDQCHDVISGMGLAPGQQLDFFAAEDGRLVLKVTG